MTASPFIVYAASSLEPAFRRLIPAFEQESGASVQAVYGHSGALRLEIAGHMACDLFCSADKGNAALLEQTGLARGLFPFARNRMIVATRNERRFQSEDWLEILCDPSLSIGTSTPINSPEGDSAKRLFQNIAKTFPEKLGSKIIAQHAVALIGGSHTDEALEDETGAAFILKHGVDAAVIYGSWASRIAAEGLKVHEIAPEVQPDIVCHGCLPRSGKAPAPLKRAFQDFLLSGTAQSILQEEGFLKA